MRKFSAFLALLFFSLLVFGFYGAQSYPPVPSPTKTSQAKQEQSKQSTQKANSIKGAANNLPSPIDTSPSKVTEAVTSKNAKDSKETAPDKNRIWEIIIAVVTAIATAVMAWFTVALARSTRKLWEAGEKQIRLAREEFNATHRPWLSVKVPSIVSDMTFKGHAAQLAINYTIKNVGSTPAIGVRFTAHIVPRIQNSSGIGIPDALRPKFEAFRTPVAGVGDVIFPGDEKTWSGYISMAKQDLELARKNPLRETEYFLNKIVPEIIGCVSYNSTFDKCNYQTGFIYTIIRIDPDRPDRRYSIDSTNDTVIPMERLILSDALGGGGYAD